MDELPVPPRVHDMVLHRLDGLGERGRQVLALAAVSGGEVDFQLVQEVGTLANEAVAGGLEELVTHGLVMSDGERFRIAHARVRRVVYDTLLVPRARPCRPPSRARRRRGPRPSVAEPRASSTGDGPERRGAPAATVTGSHHDHIHQITSLRSHHWPIRPMRVRQSNSLVALPTYWFTIQAFVVSDGSIDTAE
jgi:hypothetical protein